MRYDKYSFMVLCSAIKQFVHNLEIFGDLSYFRHFGNRWRLIVQIPEGLEMSRAVDGAFDGSQRTKQATASAVILLAPSGGGKDTVIGKLADRGIAYPCVRETTRQPREGDNGHYRFVTVSDFEVGLGRGDYLLAHRFSSNWYGVPVAEVLGHWESGQIAILKGGIDEVPETKTRLREICPNAKVATIQIFPEPDEAWIRVIRSRSHHDAEARIQESYAALEAARNRLRHEIDYSVVNLWGDLQPVVSGITSFIQRWR